MAKAVVPIALDEQGGWRWNARTSSIRDTTEALSRLWVRVAQQAGAGEDEEGIRLRTRTSVLTLVVVAPRPEVVQRAMAAIAMLAARQRPGDLVVWDDLQIPGVNQAVDDAAVWYAVAPVLASADRAYAIGTRR